MQSRALSEYQADGIPRSSVSFQLFARLRYRNQEHHVEVGIPLLLKPTLVKKVIQDFENAYERDNQWMLARAARFGDEKIAFVCLWNGEGGDGPGGAKHLMEEAGRKTTWIYWLDTRKLWD